MSSFTHQTNAAAAHLFTLIGKNKLRPEIKGYQIHFIDDRKKVGTG